MLFDFLFHKEQSSLNNKLYDSITKKIQDKSDNNNKMLNSMISNYRFNKTSFDEFNNKIHQINNTILN